MMKFCINVLAQDTILLPVADDVIMFGDVMLQCFNFCFKIDKKNNKMYFV